MNIGLFLPSNFATSQNITKKPHFAVPRDMSIGSLLPDVHVGVSERNDAFLVDLYDHVSRNVNS